MSFQSGETGATPGSIRVGTFNRRLREFLVKKLGFHGGKREDILNNLIKTLFGNLTSPFTDSRNLQASLKKFDAAQVQEFLNSVRDIKIKQNVAKAIRKASDVVDYTLLNHYVMQIKEVDRFQQKIKKTRIYKWYNLLSKKIGSPLQHKLEQLATHIADKNQGGKKKSPSAILATLMTNLLTNPYLSGILSFVGWRTVVGSIPCVLSFFPLKHVNEIEVARSGKILKFRASGSIFLAQQEGGKDAIRIEGTLYKTEVSFLLILWFLFLYGRGKLNTIDMNSPLSVTGVTATRALTDILFTNTELQKPSYEFHRTFPFVSRHFIIPNCYIETITFEDKLPLKDVINYSILLRTYDKSEKVDFHFKDSQENVLTGIGTIPAKKKYGFTSDIIEFAVNAGWRVFNASGILADEQEWKLGSATKFREATSDEETEIEARIKAENIVRAGNDLPALTTKEESQIRDQVLGAVFDTYYNVDAGSIASVVFLSIMGAM